MDKFCLKCVVFTRFFRLLLFFDYINYSQKIQNAFLLIEGRNLQFLRGRRRRKILQIAFYSLALPINVLKISIQIFFNFEIILQASLFVSALYRMVWFLDYPNSGYVLIFDENILSCHLYIISTFYFTCK